MCHTTSYLGVRLSVKQIQEQLFPNIDKVKITYSCIHYENNVEAYKDFKYCPQCRLELEVRSIENIPKQYKQYYLKETDDNNEYILYLYKYIEDTDGSNNTVTFGELETFINELRAVGIPNNVSTYIECRCHNCL